VAQDLGQFVEIPAVHHVPTGERVPEIVKPKLLDPGHLKNGLEALVHPEQRDRNREWLLSGGAPARARIKPGYYAETDWQFLATDFWTLGLLHASIGETSEARSLLEQALGIWKTQGSRLAHVQAEAIPQLEKLLADL